MRPVYFDYNATTPLDPAVREAMLPFLDGTFGNPSSLHRFGQDARAALDQARERVAQALGCKPSEIVFTSGGTESINQAIFGQARRLRDKGRHLVTSAIEHHAVLHAMEYLVGREGFELTVLPVNREGFVAVDDLARALRPDTVLVSIMAANNEMGALQPVADLGALCRERGVVYHTDAVQWFGKEPVASIQAFNADLVSLCAHKLHGPKGVGLLYVRSPLGIDPLIFGGGHENERRAGTENVAGIIGLAAALEVALRDSLSHKERMRNLTQPMIAWLKGCGDITIVSPEHDRLANTVAFSVTGCDSATLLAGLDMEGICVSSGSACTAGSFQPSHVVTAMGYDAATASSALRFSLGRENTEAEVERALAALEAVINRVKSVR